MTLLYLKTMRKNFRARQKGVAAVEFAIVIGLLVLIMGGIIEFGRVFWYYNALTKATRDGARLISEAKKTELGNYKTKASTLVKYEAQAAGLVDNAGSFPPLTNSNISITCFGGAWAGTDCTNTTSETDPGPEYVTVEITDYSVAFGSWFAIPLPTGNWLLKPHTTMRYMR